MPAPPIRMTAEGLDLSSRVYSSAAVVASPALAAETIICSVTCGENIAAVEGVLLVASAAFTVGTDGTAVNLRIRKTNASGTVLWASGDTTAVAAALASLSGQGFDTAPTLPGQVYVATLQVTLGSAESAVSAARLFALVV